MVNVLSANKKIKVSVSAKKNINAVDSSNNMARFYQKLAQEWATSDSIVENTDYSSKYYAEKSKNSAEISANLLEQTKTEAETALNNIHDSRTAAISAIDTAEATAIEHIETETTDSINSIIAEGTTQRELLNADVSSAKKAAEEAISGQLQADFSQTNSSAKDFIKNKPTKLSDFTDDLGSSPTHTHNQYLKEADTIKVQEISQEEYLSLKKKDANTLYVVCTQLLVWGTSAWGVGVWSLQDE